MLDIPIFHVNGDDPEACVHVMRLAAEYRQTFKSDVVIDLVCYRRYGHNEGDEPDLHPADDVRADPHAPDGARRSTRSSWPQRGPHHRRGAEAIKQRCHAGVRRGARRAPSAERQFKEPSALEGLWKRYRAAPTRDVPAGRHRRAPRAAARAAREAGRRCPRASTSHPTCSARSSSSASDMAAGEEPLDWGAGEALAYATLLAEGYRVRLTGQDTRARHLQPPPRGAARREDRRDATTRSQQLGPARRRFEVYNSPLSEMGVLGFEYGYSLDCPDGLVVWEAQFGDFANGAQVIIDQFIVAAERKWQRLSRPHAAAAARLRGPGPRALQRAPRALPRACAPRTTSRSCYPTTPAQIFHLLRRQVLRPLPQAAGGDDAQEPAAPPGGRLARSTSSPPARFQRRHLRRPDGRPGEGRRALLLCTRQGLLRPASRRATSARTTPSPSSASSSSTRSRATSSQALVAQMPKLQRAVLGAGGAEEHGRLALHLPARCTSWLVARAARR